MQENRNTPAAWLKFMATRLATLYPGREAQNIAALAIEEATGIRRLDLPAFNEKLLGTDQQNQLQKWLHELQQGIPVQYVVGNAWFYNRPFYVSQHVLIPRPETEELALWVMEHIHNNEYILDAGTGSGCIAITLAAEKPGCHVFGMDKSTEALQTATANNKRYGSRVILQQADLLQADCCKAWPAMDIIVSNPPYVTSWEKTHMANHVLGYEPHKALFVPDADPLVFYRAIAGLAQKKLKPGGSIFVEINENLGEETCNVFTKHDFRHCEMRKDIHGKPRMLKIS